MAVKTHYVCIHKNAVKTDKLGEICCSTQTHTQHESSGAIAKPKEMGNLSRVGKVESLTVLWVLKLWLRLKTDSQKGVALG